MGIFAALDQLKIAPAIVQGLFYAALAIIVGSAIIAIGGGGIVPMRAVWEKFLDKVEQEAPRIRAEVQQAPTRVHAATEAWKTQGQHEMHEEEHHHPPAPRF